MSKPRFVNDCPCCTFLGTFPYTEVPAGASDDVCFCTNLTWHGAGESGVGFTFQWREYSVDMVSPLRRVAQNCADVDHITPQMWFVSLMHKVVPQVARMGLLCKCAADCLLNGIEPKDTR